MKFSMKTISCLLMMIIFCFFVFSACGYINRNETEDSSRQPDNRSGGLILSESYSGEIFISDGWLYYCDPLRDCTLYAYNLKTKEEKLITDRQGTLYKTYHGGFYLIAKELYMIKDLDLSLLCELPEEGEFVDCCQNKIYWTARRRFMVDSFEQAVPQYLYAWDMDSKDAVAKDSSECIYDISATEHIIGSFLVLDDTVYIGQSDGMYLLDCETKEVKRIFERSTLKQPYIGVLEQMYTDGEYIVFQGAGGEEGTYWLYAITPEADSPQEIWAATNTFTATKEGVLYFNNPGILSYDFKDGSDRRLDGDSKFGGLSYHFVDFFEDCIVLRMEIVGESGYNSIYLLDMSTGTIECIISE